VLYVPLVVGTFAAIGVVGRSPSVSDLDGLGKRSPRLAVALTVLLLAQAGVPLTAGFVAKFGVIRAAVEAGSASLAVVAMLGAVVAAYLYLRVVVAMWMRESTNTTRPVVGAATSTVLVVCTTLTVVVGLAPGVLLGLLAAPGR
jgi:NADH-quinone oxidoreductase subunit N